ncbi:MAG: GAF domain-containing protein [Blastocatellia bacterium]
MSEREKELERHIAELESECRELREKARLVDVNRNRAGSSENEDANTDQAALANDRLFDQFDKAKATIEVSQKASEATARAIRTMAQGKHEQTLDIIAHGTHEVLGCDAVVLYTYNQDSGTLDHPPTMVNVRSLEKAMASKKKLSESIVNQMLERDELYMAEDVSKDPTFKDRRFTIEEGIKSCIAVPLKVDEKKVGVLFINYRTPHLFTSEDLINVELFANHAAVAINNAQLFEEQSKRLNEQKLLADFSKSVLSSVSFDNFREILGHAVAAAAKALSTEYCSIMLPDENGDFVFNAAYGWPGTLTGTFKLDKGRCSQTAYTIETEAPVITYDYSTEARFSVPQLVFEQKIRSGMSVPMIREGKLVGAMLVHTSRLRQFTEADARLLGLIANQVAMLLSIVQQYAQIEQHNKNLLALHDTSKALTSLTVGQELKPVLDFILEQATKSIKRKRGRKVVLGTIQMYNEETQELVFESIYPVEYSANYAIIGERWSIAGPRAESKRVGIAGRALLTKEPQLVARVCEDKDYIEYNPTTKSELAVPLIDAGGEVIGVLSLESGQESGFDGNDKEVLTLLAEQAVIAIRSARQIKDLQQAQAASVAKSALALMGMNSSYWRHTIQNHASAIRDIISHVNLMHATEPIVDIKSKLDEISELAGMIESYPTSEELSSEELGKLENVNALLRRRARQLQDYSPEDYRQVSIKFDLRLDDSAQVRANSNWLIRALDVIFDNAIGAMKDSPNKALLISTRMDDKYAVIEITDTGHGIPEELRHRIMNEKIKHENGSKRLGIGLLMAQSIVQTYKGNISIVSSDSMGTKIAVHLPLAQQ